MWDSSTALNLIHQAVKIQSQGDVKEALKLIDEAIAMAKQANSFEYVIQWKQHRALIVMSISGDSFPLLSSVQDALNFYQQQKNVPEQLNTLINFAGILINSGNKQQALKYLNEAEDMLSNLDASDLDEVSGYLLEGVSLSAETFIQLRSVEISRLRQLIVKP